MVKMSRRYIARSSSNGKRSETLCARCESDNVECDNVEDVEMADSHAEQSNKENEKTNLILVEPLIEKKVWT